MGRQSGQEAITAPRPHNSLNRNQSKGISRGNSKRYSAACAPKGTRKRCQSLQRKIELVSRRDADQDLVLGAALAHETAVGGGTGQPLIFEEGTRREVFRRLPGERRTCTVGLDARRRLIRIKPA